MRSVPMGVLSCFVEHCGFTDISGRSLEGHIIRNHNNDDGVKETYHPFPKNEDDKIGEKGDDIEDAYSAKDDIDFRDGFSSESGSIKGASGEKDTSGQRKAQGIFGESSSVVIIFRLN